jgi:glycosyl transferase family 11/glycosyl transferase family 7 (putative galactosyltransferase)
MITFSALGTIGRLGNAMFQIASVIGIADKLNTLACFPQWKYESSFKRPLPKGHVSNAQPIEEKHFHFDESLFQLDPAKNYDISGYLQTEKYFEKERILKQFEFSDSIKLLVTARFQRALKRPTVAISIRRGDFVNNPNYYQIPVTWYLNAYYKYFNADYNVLIFSDDLNYCKLHLSVLPNVYFAEQLTDIEQLCLMSLCDNHIISNSTFSWWGAYLSQSKKIIRPEKNFAGRLAKENNEKDYWPVTWEVFKQNRIDLSDTTFIIPVYYDHEHRMQNMMLTLSFLNTCFKTNILIGEQGGNRFEHLQDYADYIRFDLPDFHRTKMINEMAKQAKTPVIVNWDCDNICPPAQLPEAVKLVRNGCDIAYPFDGTVHRVPRYLFPFVAESLDVVSVDEQRCVKKHSSVGHAVVMNKESFIKAGMENEHFISWGPEDSERFNRYNILGLNIQRVPGAIYHMDHYVGENSSSKNKYFHANEREFLKIATRSREQLQEIIKGWAWVN